LYSLTPIAYVFVAVDSEPPPMAPVVVVVVAVVVVVVAWSGREQKQGARTARAHHRGTYLHYHRRT
jgi:hypothetical protein